MELSFFLKGADGRYDRFDEVHRQRAHSVEELRSWLEDAGFSRIQIENEAIASISRGSIHENRRTLPYHAAGRQARALLIDSTQLVETARAIHGLSRTAAAALGGT
jgi:hypothetical protein